jgi:hypothetical protein
MPRKQTNPSNTYCLSGKLKQKNRHKIRKTPPYSILFVFLDLLRLTSDCKRLRSTNPSHNHKFRQTPNQIHPQGHGLRNHNSAKKGEKKAATPKKHSQAAEDKTQRRQQRQQQRARREGLRVLDSSP